MIMSTSLPRSGSTGSRPPGRGARLVSVKIATAQIALGDFLKWAGIVPTGGQAKMLAQSGRVRVNGCAEHRRGRCLGPGDRVAVDGREYQVVAG